MISQEQEYKDRFLWAVRELISFAGDDPDREGLKETPERVFKAYGELCSGYGKHPEDVFKTFEVGYRADEVVLLRDIPFASVCEHHMLPFSGVAHVAYLPCVKDGVSKVVGVSKLVRLLEIFARRLQVQERITCQMTGAMDKHLTPVGSACVLEATHQCMTCRGVRTGGVMVTSSLTGAFKAKPEARAELFTLIRK